MNLASAHGGQSATSGDASLSSAEGAASARQLSAPALPLQIRLVFCACRPGMALKLRALGIFGWRQALGRLGVEMCGLRRVACLAAVQVRRGSDERGRSCQRRRRGFHCRGGFERCCHALEWRGNGWVCRVGGHQHWYWRWRNRFHGRWRRRRWRWHHKHCRWPAPHLVWAGQWRCRVGRALR